jgi:hypothetical protein
MGRYKWEIALQAENFVNLIQDWRKEEGLFF